MFKKLSAIILASSMVGTLLTGCSGSDTSTTTTPTTSATIDGTEAVESTDDIGFDWSGKTINFYVTHSAGGDTDYYARLLAQNLESILGCTVVCTNVTGSNGAICMQQYKDAPNDDGLTFICTNCGSLACNEASGMTDFGYDAFEPVAIYGKQANQNIVVRADSPYETFSDFVDYAKEHNGSDAINLGISTGGVAYYLTMIMEKAGCNFNIIDIGDNAERIASLLGGNSDATIVTYSLVKDYIEAGELKTLGAIPKSDNEGNTLDIPTVNDVIPELVDDSVFACLAPKGTPENIVNALNAAINQATDNADWNQACNDFSYQSRYVLDVDDSVALLKAQRDQVMQYADMLQGN